MSVAASSTGASADGGIDQDAREDLHARALRHAAGHHLEALEKVVLGQEMRTAQGV